MKKLLRYNMYLYINYSGDLKENDQKIWQAWQNLKKTKQTLGD